MPPPPSQKPGQASISAFFKPKSSQRPITKSCQPDRAQVSNGYARTSNLLDTDTGASSSAQPPHKRSKLNNKDGPRRETIDRMSKWKFTALQPSDNVSSELDEAASQATPTERSQHDQARHDAFRKTLLGPNFAIDRHASNQMQIDDMSSAHTFSHSESRTSTGTKVDAMVVDDDDDDDDNQHEQAAQSVPGTWNRFTGLAAPESTPAPCSHRDSSMNKTKGKPKASGAGTGPSYTPLEKQILELKAEHPGVLLIIEVGYKLKFYGEDARIASKELSIMCFPERNLLTAMIPVHRLHIHVKRLIQAGHKVGVVRQIETRALKAASKNAYTPFVRKLTALYTASTWVDDLSSLDDLAANMGDAYTNQPKSLMAIVEQSERGNAQADRVSIGIVSVEVNTGHLTYDQFSDGHARSELETRIAHLAPAEVLIPPQLTKPTEKVISYLLGNGADGGVRIERLAAMPDYNQAFQSVTRFYRDRGLESPEVPEVPEVPGSSEADTTKLATTLADGADKRSSPLISLIVSLPQLSLIALAQIIQHLQAFQLESICTLSTNFRSFSSRTTMLLNSNTLANLEIFRTANEQTERGSLIWLLDKCKSAMGRRLLRKWVSRPLTDIDKLQERLDAVEALRDGKSYVLRRLDSVLHGLPDLERGLARMTYGRATPTELATVLLSLNRVTQEFKADEAATWKTQSSLIDTHLLSLASGKQVVQTYLNQISIKEARANNKADLYLDADVFPAIQASKDNMAIIDGELREHLREIRKLLHRPSLDYVSVAGVDYLVEVRVADAKKVPVEWLRVSATKSMVRFHTPEVMRLSKIRDQHKETLDAAAQEAFARFVRELCKSEYVVLRNVVASLAVLDVLLSLAHVARAAGYTRPVFLRQPQDAEASVPVEIIGMRHAILEVVSAMPYIPNDVSLSTGDSGAAILLSGCNMGGKSSVVRALGLVIIMAQIGSFVAADVARIGVHDAVYVRMGARDRMFSGRSTYMVEVSETADILGSLTSRSMVILDELGRGTSSRDGYCLAAGVLEYLLTLGCPPNTVFITHYLQLASMQRRYPHLRNMHMAFTSNSRNLLDPIHLVYKLRPGIAHSFGIHAAHLARLPLQIIHSASTISSALYAKHTNRSAFLVLKHAFANPPQLATVSTLQHLLFTHPPT